MARINKILHNGMYILPQTVTDAVLDNQMKRTLTELLTDKLSAVDDDTAHGEITFEAGLAANGKGVVASKVVSDFLVSIGFTPNFGGSGFSLQIVDGKSYLTVDNAYIRNKATFDELDIKKIDHIGGANVTSPASCKIASVTTDASAYKCYFSATDGERTINNDWRVGDQALCHAFNLTTPRYYWRLVTAVSAEPIDGYHWVALSITDCDTDSDVPMAEDTIVCFGNRTDKDRQSVIIMDSEGASAPYLRQLKGINSYTIGDANIVTQLSPSKNIIRGEQIELATSSGNKGLMDIANETLTSAKTYADGVGTNATSTAKSYADGLFSDAEKYTQEREAYLQTQITANDEEIALRATKVEVQTVSDKVGALATRVTGAEASIKTNADNIALKANKTEVQGQFDNLQVGQRNYAPNTSVAMTAYQFRDCYYPDNFRGKIAKITYRTTYNITALPTGSYAGIQVHITYNDGTQSWIGAGVNDGITVGTATNKLIKKTISVENKSVRRFRVYCQFKEGASGTFSIDQLMVNPDTFADWSPAPEDTADSIGKLGTRVTAAESSLTVQSDRISSVVSEIEAMVVDYTFDDFIVGDLAYVDTTEGVVLGYNNDVHCHWLRIKDVKKGDVIRFETSGYTGALVYSITGCDGDADGAEVALIRDQNPIVDQYTWLGKQLFDVGHDDEEISETLVPMDCAEVYVYTTDDWYNKGKTKVSHIKAKMTAQSRINQTADNIRLQVGQAGINLDSKVITLDASKTIVTGDLAVRTVKTYWDAAQTQLKSAFNGNGDGTIVYYYPNGMVMRQDSFVTDSSGNAIGMRTTYYNADGSVSWVLDNSGLKTTLSDYWEALNGAQPMAYTTDYNTMMNTCKQYLDQAMQHFDKSTFSRFVSQSGNYKNYNGKVAKGLKSSEAPTAVTLFAGVLVYSVELYKDGLLPTYIVTYEQVTTAQNQVSAIMTQKFNIGGEVN